MRADRREAVETRDEGVEYSQVVIHAARRLLDKATLEQQEVMLGAAYSFAAYEEAFANKGRRQAVQQCTCLLCGAEEVPGWYHLAWSCGRFQEERGDMAMPAPFVTSDGRSTTRRSRSLASRGTSHSRGAGRLVKSMRPEIPGTKYPVVVVVVVAAAVAVLIRQWCCCHQCCKWIVAGLGTFVLPAV